MSSSNVWDKTASFIAKNKTAIALTTLVALSAAGTYVYVNQLSEVPVNDSTVDGSKKKKKNKKKKTSTKTAKQDVVAETGVVSNDKIYPTVDGVASFTDEDVEKLSAEEKDLWGNALKEDGNQQFKNKNYEKAIELYSSALRIKKDPVYYSNRSACYASLDDHENVIKDTTEAINLKPDYTKCLIRRATSYEKVERFTDAMFDLTALTIYGGFSNKSLEPALERVLRKHSIKIVNKKLENLKPELPSASSICSFFGAFREETEFANCNENSEEGSGAKFLYEGLKNLNANTADSYELADSFFNQSVKAFNVESLTSSSPEAEIATIALEYSSAFHFLKNSPLEAISDIEKAVALQPRAKTYIYLALLCADRGAIEEATTYFDKAIQMDSECPDIYYHLGQMYYLTGDLVNGEKNFERARDLNPGNVYAYIQLACISYKNGNVSDADEKFSQAKSKFPTSPEIPNYYGEILADKGDIAGAIKQFDTAARLQELLPTFSVGAIPLINKASIISREDLTRLNEAEEYLIKAVKLDPKSEIARISLAQIKLQKDEPEEAIKLFEESVDLARSYEEKVQATSFAEASKMQLRIKQDPILSAKVREVMAAAQGF